MRPSGPPSLGELRFTAGSATADDKNLDDDEETEIFARVRAKKADGAAQTKHGLSELDCHMFQVPKAHDRPRGLSGH
jgi:hypothetical protein